MTPCQATRGLNLSEDIFAGLDLSLRGGWTVYREYFHVGKAGLERLWHRSLITHPNDLNRWLQRNRIRAETWAL